MKNETFLAKLYFTGISCYIALFPIVGAKFDTSFNNLFANEDALDNVFESLVDFLDDSGCTFQCPDGQKPVPRAGFKPTHNGCGSYGFQIKSSNLPEMTDCCNTHDFCYETCNVDRETCDNEFKNCLEQMCEKKKRHIPDCKATADMMHKGAVTLGCKAFKEAQKNGCTCIPKSAKKQGSKIKGHKKGEL